VKWLLTAVRREAWRIAKRHRDELTRTASLFEEDGREAPSLPVRHDQAPDEVVLREDRRRVLWGHVQSLPERCRQLLRVVAFADRPDYAQIADALGMPVGSIGPTRGRCLAKLRQELAADPLWEGRQS
jgi:RNA polymerase sigma factor (sigma-70 family)